MRKFIILLTIIVILISSFSACNKANDTTVIKTLKIKKLIDNKPLGWIWREKEITKSPDVEKVLSKLKSFKYKDIEQEQVYGFGLIIEYSDDKDYTYVFSGDRININGKYYGMPTQENDEMNKMYDTLDYTENPSEP
jgi:hypothetical protein